MVDFYQIAELTLSFYNALQDVARLSPCYLFTLHGFLLTLRSALALESPDMRFHREMVPRAVISEITYRIVSHVSSQYKPRLFQTHSALFRLLVSVAVIVHNEGCPEVERVTFLRGLSNWKSSVFFITIHTVYPQAAKLDSNTLSRWCLSIRDDYTLQGSCVISGKFVQAMAGIRAVSFRHSDWTSPLSVSLSFVHNAAGYSLEDAVSSLASSSGRGPYSLCARTYAALICWRPSNGLCGNDLQPFVQEWRSCSCTLTR